MSCRSAKILRNEIKDKTKDLRGSEERYKKLVESAQDIIFSINRDGEFLSINTFGANFLSGALFEHNHPTAPTIIRNYPRTFSGNRFLTICLPMDPLIPKPSKKFGNPAGGRPLSTPRRSANDWLV